MTSVTTGEASTRVPSTQRDEIAKALNLLIHDLRAPLSVAQGYIRLLQQNRLEAEADRQRAMTQSMEALGRITRLCEEAAAFVAEPASTSGPVMTVRAAEFIDQVTDACAARCSPLTWICRAQCGAPTSTFWCNQLRSSCARSGGPPERSR